MTSKLITFDAFNTLFHLKHSASHIYSLEAMDFGIHVPNTLNSSLKFNRLFLEQSQTHPNFNPTPEIWWKRLMRVYFYSRIEKNQIQRLDSVFDDMFLCIYNSFATEKYFQVYPDVYETLNHLKNTNVSLGIISNSDKRTVSIIQSLKLKEFFDFIITSHEAQVLKPDPKIFQLAQSTGDYTTKMHIGDDLINDYQGAINAGWNSFLIDKDKRKTENSISNIKELLEFI